MNNPTVLLLVLVVASIGIVMAFKNYLNIKKPKKNYTPEEVDMCNLSEIIRKGARAFMLTEYQTIVIVVLIIAGVISSFVEITSGLTFLLGSLMSSLACVIGMEGALYANYRVARRAFRVVKLDQNGDVLNSAGATGRTVRTALKGGTISGLSVQGFGLLGLVIIIMIQGGINVNAESHGLFLDVVSNPTTARLTFYSLGCSLVAMFNRVAGGNFTKAADISADIVAKIRHDMPEDDPRMANTIADFIGDNVNDIAGNCSDLLESFVATLVSCQLIATILYEKSVSSDALFSATCTFPIMLAGIGLFSCIIGLSYALHHRASDNPAKELNLTTDVSAVITIIGSAFAAKYVFDGIELYPSFSFGWTSPWAAAILGIVSGVLVGKITEYYTSTDFKHVKELASIAPEGDAFVVTKGDAIGSKSVLPVVLIIGVSIVISYLICGTYGIAVAAAGMLSFVATTVSIDAFGPISDNAGGIAEGCHLPPAIREITDKLDATGNTTAAIGKGFAICSAAYATIALIIAYVGSYSEGETMLNIAEPMVIVGAMIGGALVEYFSAMLTDNTIESAKLMADAGDKQLTPEVIAGTAKPNYNEIITMATRQALRKMTTPSLLALLIPVIGGFIFGPDFVGGLLVGATITAICRAIFMGNSGGAFDNAKKYIEEGLLPGHAKGSNAHKSAVTGDTVGDTRKDVVGVALDIFIKTMSTVSNTLAPVFASMHLF